MPLLSYLPSSLLRIAYFRPYLHKRTNMKISEQLGAGKNAMQWLILPIYSESGYCTSQSLTVPVSEEKLTPM